MWLTTKKRGLDNDQIERDGERAKQARRQRLNQQPKPSTNNRISNNKKSKNINTTKRRSSPVLDSLAGGTNRKAPVVVHSSSSDDDEEDELLSDDEEEEEELLLEDDDDEEEELLLDDPKNSDDDDDEDSSDNDKNQRKKQPQTTSRSIPYTKQRNSAVATKSNPKQSHHRTTAKKLTSTSSIKTDVTVDLPSSPPSSSDESTSFFRSYKKRTSVPPPPPQQPQSRSKLQQKPQRKVTSSSSSNSSRIKTTTTTLPPKKSSAILPTRKDNDDDDVVSIASSSNSSSHRRVSKPNRLESSSLNKNDDDGLEDTPLVPGGAIRKKPKAKVFLNQGLVAKSSNSNIVNKGGVKPKVLLPNSKKFSSTTTKKLAIQMDDDYCSDIDEAVAIACALQESTKISAAAATTTTATDPPHVYLLDDDDKNDEANNNDENDNDDYNHNDEDDEDARAATSILATANALSAQVLQTMAGWSHGATDGMIVDGALAIMSCSGSGDNNRDSGIVKTTTSAPATDHDWISLDTMQHILPKSVILSEYQLIGINWMALLHGMKCEVEGTKKHTNVNGILADEMGLGKTCQTIAFLSWLKYINTGKKNVVSGMSNSDALELNDSDDVEEITDQNVSPHLVIAPASVVSNWELEFKKFAPHLNVVKYHGSMKERLDIQDRLRQFLPSGRKKSNGGTTLDVILAPVTYFQQEKSDDRAFLRKFKYDYMVVDEAHLLKNARGMRYRSLDRFSTMHRLLLTGTPVQNSPKELMSLLCFLMPLFSRKSTDSFDDTQGHDGGESMLQYFVSMQNGHDSNDQVAYAKLKQLFSPFVLRRRKQDVLSQILPPKEQRVEFVELDTSSRAQYNSVISDHVKSKKKGGTTSSAYEHLFTQLRKAAHHPLMLRSRYIAEDERKHLTEWFYKYGAFRGEGCTLAKVAEAVEKYTDFDIHLMASELIEENQLRREQLGRYVLDEQDLFCSAKFVRLQKLLPELISGGHRILIFSVWTTCLDLLSCLLEQMGLSCLRMDGQTAVSERQSLIDKFNRDTSIPIFLLSTKACGLGLNLTSADTCIQHDLDFNPAVDAQAEDRCHRIGQTKPVTIIKLVSKDTVDEDIYAMQQRKSKMNAAIMGSDAEWKKHSKDEKKLMLQTAVDRFLMSPKVKSNESIKSGLAKENCENVDDSGEGTSEYL